MMDTMFKYFLTILMLLFFNVATAKPTTECVVNIEDINTGTTYKVNGRNEKNSIDNLIFGYTVRFVVPFSLPSKGYSDCMLKYLDENSGTSLSCAFDELGHHYVQSDRTSDDDKPRKNSLTVRYKDLHFDINAVCK